MNDEEKTPRATRGKRRTSTQIAEALELYDLARAALPAAARADLNDLVWRCDAPPEVAALRRALEIALRPAPRTIIRGVADATPSPEDVAFTRRLREAGRVMGIDVVDHLVVGAGEVVSLRERRLW